MFIYIFVSDQQSKSSILLVIIRLYYDILCTSLNFVL
jgi:hypothetical protein